VCSRGPAALTTFALGAALFGAMILVPLYYQEVRHESVIVTGLLTGPQGLGMLMVMPLSGRLSERLGGGRVALAGVAILALATIPLAFVDASTSILEISLVLVARGIGIGFSFMPAMTAAFASLRTDQLSDATPQMNVLQRVGGAIGTAVLAVVLQRASGHAPLDGPPCERLRHGLLVVAGDCAARADPLPGAVQGGEGAGAAEPGGVQRRGDRRAARSVTS